MIKGSYWFSDVMKSVFQLRKINDESFDLVNMLDGIELSLCIEEFEVYKLREIPEDDLGIVLLQVVGEYNLADKYKALMNSIADAVDSKEWHKAGILARKEREFFSNKQERLECQPVWSPIRVNYLTKERLQKIVDQHNKEKRNKT